MTVRTRKKRLLGLGSYNSSMASGLLMEGAPPKIGVTKVWPLTFFSSREVTSSRIFGRPEKAIDLPGGQFDNGSLRKYHPVVPHQA